MATDIWRMTLSSSSLKTIIIMSRISAQFNNISNIVLTERKMKNFPRDSKAIVHSAPYDFEMDPYCTHPRNMPAMDDYLTRYIYKNNIVPVKADLICFRSEYYVFDGIKVMDTGHDSFLEELTIIRNSIPEDYWNGIEIKLENDSFYYW